jgi:hypothetical protein
MIAKKPAPDLIRRGCRFSEKIMLDDRALYRAASRTGAGTALVVAGAGAGAGGASGGCAFRAGP